MNEPNEDTLPPTVRHFLDHADLAMAALRHELLGDREDAEFDAAVQRVRAQIVAARNMYDTGVCRNCHQPIHSPRGGSWRHTAQPGWHDPDAESVGCRAASFDRLGHWDNSLDQRWKARP